MQIALLICRLLFFVFLVSAANTQAETETYIADPEHTFVYWGVTHFGTSTVRGRFDRTSGAIRLDRQARTGTVQVEIDIASISSGIELFDKKLRSEQFFDAETFPKANFIGTQFKYSAEKLTEVVGELTLRGKTNPLTLTAKNFNCYNSPLAKKEVCGGDFEASFSRGQFGINYGWPFVSDTVKLQIQIEAFKESP